MTGDTTPSGTWETLPLVSVSLDDKEMYSGVSTQRVGGKSHSTRRQIDTCAGGFLFRDENVSWNTRHPRDEWDWWSLMEVSAQETKTEVDNNKRK